jgi:hypothetical protein
MFLTQLLSELIPAVSKTWNLILLLTAFASFDPEIPQFYGKIHYKLSQVAEALLIKFYDELKQGG